MAQLDFASFQKHLSAFDFPSLFVDVLGWNHAPMADAIFIAHASAGGVLARQSSSWAGRGLQVQNLNLS